MRINNYMKGMQNPLILQIQDFSAVLFGSISIKWELRDISEVTSILYLV